MSDFKLGNRTTSVLSRRHVLQIGAGVAGATLIPGLGNIGWALADDKPAIGTWPAGSEGDTVYIGAAVPLTGTYAVQGEDERKGMELAVEHINDGHELMKTFAPKLDKGLLGKKVELLSADSAAKLTWIGWPTSNMRLRLWLLRLETLRRVCPASTT